MRRSARHGGLRRGSDAPAGHDGQVPFADLEERWQAYLQSDEFVTFHAVIESLLSLPPTSQLAERRADFELLIHLLDRLGHALSVKHVNKAYRAQYSPDVQLSGYLYSTLLTAFTLLPSYTLNGQEFYVSDTVLDQCQSLQFVFQETCKELKKQFENLQPYSLEHIRNDVKRSLVYFDRTWCRFEIPALEEIEAIHRQACRPLIEAIDVEQALTQAEGGGAVGSRGCCAPGAHRLRLEVQRSKFMEKVCELNRLANIDGKGRTDMDLACVLEAERIAGKPMCTHLPSKDEGVHGRCGSGNCAPPVLLRVARSLLRSLARLRRVLQRYARCLYQLNSHLANNPDLVRGLELFESAWEKANKYLVQPGPRRLAQLTYSIVIAVSEPGFMAALDNLDPEFLVASLPRALLFHEMRKAASSASAASSSHPGGARSAAAAVKQVKATERSDGPGASPAAGAGPQLPRPALDAARSAASASSALQRSPLARAFLSQDVAGSYNDAVTTMERFTEARLARVRAQLISPPSGSSRGSGGSSAPPTATAARPRLPTGSSASSGRAGLAEQPPRTPCPPRMAVPNASRPATGKGAVALQRVGTGPPIPASPLHEIKEPEVEDESDDEDEKLAITLATLKGATSSDSSKPPTAQARPQDQPAPVAAGSSAKAREELEERQVIAAISTLSLHLQRERPNEWNELIQVVLQGLMAARGPVSSNPVTVHSNPAEIL